MEIEPPETDPPDYVVNDKFAVEVRRLNLKIQTNGQTKGEEEAQIPLRETVKKILKEFGPPTKKQGWYVDCEYDFSNPLPKPKVIKREAQKYLSPYARPSNNDLIKQYELGHRAYNRDTGEPILSSSFFLNLPCGIRLALTPGSPTSAMFLLQSVSDGVGILLLQELIANIKDAIREKSQKIKKRQADFDEWWLILIDHIGYVQLSGLSQVERKNLRTAIRVKPPWSRIIIVSHADPNVGYEL